MVVAPASAAANEPVAAKPAGFRLLLPSELDCTIVRAASRTATTAALDAASWGVSGLVFGVTVNSVLVKSVVVWRLGEMLIVLTSNVSREGGLGLLEIFASGIVLGYLYGLIVGSCRWEEMLLSRLGKEGVRGGT